MSIINTAEVSQLAIPMVDPSQQYTDKAIRDDSIDWPTFPTYIPSFTEIDIIHTDFQYSSKDGSTEMKKNSFVSNRSQKYAKLCNN